MFAPLGGPGLGLTFIETYLACVAGGVFGSAVFYFASGYFMKRAVDKLHNFNEKQIRKGLPIKVKKKFNRVNRTIVKLKNSIGIIGISFWGPFFLSVPIGSIITAKFYRHKKHTFPLIVLGMFINGFATTGIAFLLYG